MFYVLIFQCIFTFLLVATITFLLVRSSRGTQHNDSFHVPTDYAADVICPVCQYSQVQKGLPIVDSMNGHRLGPKYSVNRKKFSIHIMHCAPMYADICMNCGTVIRTYINVPKESDWIHGDSPFSRK